MYFQLVVVVLFAARCLANNHITDDCGVFPSVTQFVENRLNSSIATENVTIDFEASLCYSSRSCYGDIEPSEFSGEEGKLLALISLYYGLVLWHRSLISAFPLNCGWLLGNTRNLNSRV